MCKLHGVRFIKGIKIFESMSQPKSTVVLKNNTAKLSAMIIIIPTTISACCDDKF